MKRLMTPPVAGLIVFTGLAAALLANDFTPTRAAVWGTAWAITAVAIVRHELKRPTVRSER
ncbi:hypothetical protein GS938_20100 [Rhodococcus hoagii]|nr:hypothetical protein [Prescottella equi]NKV95334.1 hypothetical protein [Prescottella equi]NKW07670.1 hypothetical protein [Prescottella equi]NKW08037.1 hypothetical protein [Prescottella equi]